MPKNSSTKNIKERIPCPIVFPDVAQASTEPNGLLAYGGQLSPEYLLSAYQQGIFPWYNPDEPILWWSPDPRFGFTPGQVHLSKSRKRYLRHQNWQVRADSQCQAVIAHCASAPRKGQSSTWLNSDMIHAYTQLHQLGYVHSIEVFEQDQLIGGLYGVVLGQLFFAESMFSLRSQASSLALFALSQVLAQWHWPWIDAQIENPHLSLLGGQPIARQHFIQLIRAQSTKSCPEGTWQVYFANKNFIQFEQMNRN